MSKRMSAEAKAASKKAATQKGRITTVVSRQLQPVIIQQARRQTKVTILAPEELGTLKVDPTYQRTENRELVNLLIAVLEAGGTVPDPITVAVRPNGDRYVVDGQQRWTAHYLTQRPLAAVLFEVDTIAEERRLFSVLNTYKRPNPNIRIKAWSGPSQALVNYLQESPQSPIMGELAFLDGGATKYPASSIVRGVAWALGAAKLPGNTESMLRMLDRLYIANPDRAKRVAVAFCALVRQVFEANKALTVATQALGAAAAVRWPLGSALVQPSKQELYNLRRLHWHVPAASGAMMLPMLKGEVLRRWKGDK